MPSEPHKVNEILNSLGLGSVESYNDEGKLIAAVQLGRMGGARKSLKKAKACQQNGMAPCKNGKKRGRPFSKKKSA